MKAINKTPNAELEEILCYLLALVASYDLSAPEDLELLNTLMLSEHLQRAA